VADIDATATAPRFPPGRYGRRREPGRSTRRRVLLFVVAGAVVGLLLAVVLYQRYGPGEFEPQLVTFQTANGHVMMRFQVHKPSGDPAVCHVRARDRSGAEVGAADVDVPAGTTVTVTYTLATKGVPVSAEVPVCRAR
jgi:Domain of unknown function (DUF4307)